MSVKYTLFLWMFVFILHKKTTNFQGNHNDVEDCKNDFGGCCNYSVVFDANLDILS